MESERYRRASTRTGAAAIEPPTTFRCQRSATQENLQTAGDFATTQVIDFRQLHELLTEMARSTAVEKAGRQRDILAPH
jgi:hypothetical protein